MGQCPSCKAWNSLEEAGPEPASFGSSKPALTAREITANLHTPGDGSPAVRRTSGIPQLDSVLGGGFMPGSVILLGGEPGIGKSTLLLELARAGHSILYVSGEESTTQVSERAARLMVRNPRLQILSENHLANVFTAWDQLSPDLIFVDSIQTIYSQGGRGFSGSPSQIRESTQLLLEKVKGSNVTAILTGHVTKEGTIAGPKLLEHAVDVVLYFESASDDSVRFVRAVKNRFGATGELAVFTMQSDGLRILDMTRGLIDLKRVGGIGSVLFLQMEGSHVLPLEVQVLVTPTGFSNGRRIGESIEIARIHLVAAILEKYLSYKLSQCDIFVRIAGGPFLRDPSGDLALAFAMASSYLDRMPALKAPFAVFGELALTGEIRKPSHLEARIRAAENLGISEIVSGGPAQPGLRTFHSIGKALEEVFRYGS